MDNSGNSGSMQSSSGGDENIEEYDSSSRANPSFFLTPLPFSSTHDDHHHQPSAAAASASTAFFADDANPSANAFLNFNINPTTIPQLPNLPSSSSSHHNNLDYLDPGSMLNQGRPIASPRPGSSSAGVGVVAAKNPKKRTRASRRAPTTVLTTDTSNFRAMVQEFTGIPSPPFSTGNSFSSGRRLEIFRSPASSGHPLDSLYNPFRGTAQKVQTLMPSSSSSTMLNHHITVDATNVAIPTTNMANHHVFIDLPLPKLPLSNQNNQVPTFQSLLSLDHELNAMNGGDHINRDDHHDDQQQLMMIRQFDVPPPSTSPEFDRRENHLEEIHNDNVARPINRGTATTTTLDPWICSTRSLDDDHNHI